MSAITIDSSRFGTLAVASEAVIEFPTGLIGLGGHRYALLDRNPGTGFLWLHSLDDGDLALPVLDPRRFFSGFVLVISEDDRERIGVADPAEAQPYVTVRAAPDPADIVVNLRAPIVVWQGRGHQVLNGAPGAELQVRLFTQEQTADGGSQAPLAGSA